MITFLILLLIASVLGNAILGYMVKRALDQIDEYEANEEVYVAFYDQLQSTIEGMINTMREIDLRGSFESDDEVGSVFQQLKAMVESLEVFKLRFDVEEMPDAEG